MEQNGHKPVALVSMPTLRADFPSFQLALLKPTLERAGIPVQAFSLFLYFGAQIGWRINDTLSAVRSCMAGEWIWAKAAFGDFCSEQDYLGDFEASLAVITAEAGCSLDDLLRIRNRETIAFLDFCIQRIDWQRFGLIGFSVVFQQMTASLALARRLKQEYPDIPIIFGGATFEDDLAAGILQGCPYVDYIHCGDADRTFPQIVRRLQQGESLDGVPGVMQRRNGQVDYAGRAPNLQDMDATPIPEFNEYFYARKQSGYERYPHNKTPLLPIETGRGCWWGMKNHCTFCGLNRAGMDFRAKSVDSVLEMLKVLSRRHGILHFDAIDNIMATEYIEQLFGRLAEAKTDLRIHYEVRPYLSRSQLKHLRRGGLFSVQPGIESFSTRVLKLMKKHSTGMRNLAFLKWCTYYGINNLYNVLFGFAGERPKDYRLQCDLIPKILHYQPPWAIAQARPDRGSPMFTQPDSHGVRQLRPSHCYRYIYPQDRFDLQRVSYFFEHRQEDVLEEGGYEEIRSLVGQWQQSWKRRPRPSLVYSKSWDTLLIRDTRNGNARNGTINDRHARLYEFCSDARTLKAIQSEFEDDGDWIEEALTEFQRHKWMVSLDDRYLSLALPSNPYV